MMLVPGLSSGEGEGLGMMLVPGLSSGEGEGLGMMLVPGLSSGEGEGLGMMLVMYTHPLYVHTIHLCMHRGTYKPSWFFAMKLLMYIVLYIYTSPVLGQVLHNLACHPYLPRSLVFATLQPVTDSG